MTFSDGQVELAAASLRNVPLFAELSDDQFARIRGLRMVGTAPEKVALISFVLDKRSNEEVGKALDRAGIAVRVGHHCAQPSLRRFGLEATVRPSFSIYNTRDEIDRMAALLRALA